MCRGGYMKTHYSNMKLDITCVFYLVMVCLSSKPISI